MESRNGSRLLFVVLLIGKTGSHFSGKHSSGKFCHGYRQRLIYDSEQNDPCPPHSAIALHAACVASSLPGIISSGASAFMALNFKAAIKPLIPAPLLDSWKRYRFSKSMRAIDWRRRYSLTIGSLPGAPPCTFVSGDSADVYG